MTITEALLAEFEQEAGTTRKFLERLGDDHLTWTPHEKSLTAGQLALHLAEAPGGVAEMVKLDEYPIPDFSKGGPQPASVKEVLDTFDSSVAKVREVLPTISDEQLQETWRATKDGKTYIEMPRIAVLRGIMLNHWYHHRGQFGVYLRLLGASVPAAYGPSADEAPDWAKGA